MVQMKWLKRCVKILLYDTARSMFAQWHDESYINKWCVEHEDIVDKRYVMTVYEDSIDKDWFIYLRDKRDYNIKK